MAPPPRFVGTATPAAIRAVFAEADYTEAGLARTLGPDLTALMRSRGRPAFARRAGGRSAQALLARLFLFGLSTTWEQIDDLLGRDGAEACRQAGLLAGDPECRATVGVSPVGDLIVAHDRRDAHQAGAAGFVPGPAPATRRFADVVIRRRDDRVLDLGCGQGLLALLAAGQGAQVTATDLNPRAVAFTAFNAAVNGFDDIRCARGDLFAPVGGAQFDLILANPPYVISPDSTFLYRDGRGICERIAREAPPFLAEGGILQMVCNWPCHRGRAWREDLAAWFRGGGCDVWVLQTDHLGPLTYASLWLGQAHEDAAELTPAIDRWMAFYEEAGIEAVGIGIVSMRRRAPGGGAERWFEVRDMPPASGPAGETIARVLEARDALARFEDEALLEAPVALAPEARAVVLQRASISGWSRESGELRLTRGLAMAIRLDPVGAAIAGYLDGTRSARDAVAAFAAAFGVPADALLPGVPALLRQLIEMGLAVVRDR